MASKKVASQKQSCLQGITTAFIALLLSVFLLSFPASGYAAIVEHKYRIFLALFGGYLIITTVVYFELVVVGRQKFPKIQDIKKNASAVKILILAYLALTILSGIFSQYGGAFTGAERKEGVLTICIYVLTFLFVSKFFVPQKWMLILFSVSSALLCILCIVQLTGANPFRLYPEGYNYYDAGVYYSGEYLGTIGNADLCATFLCFAAGILSMSLVCFEPRQKWLLSLPLALAVFTIIEMNVDAGRVGLLGGFLLILPVAVISRIRLSDTLKMLSVVFAAIAAALLVEFSDGAVSAGNIRLAAAIASFGAALLILSAIAERIGILECVSGGSFRIGSLFFVGAVITGALLFLWFYSGKESGFIYEASELLHGRARDEFGTRRIYIWRNVLENMGGYIWLGTGPDTLAFWPIPAFERYNETLGILLTSRIDAAHNEYLNIAACQGIFALVSYLGALVLAAVRWYKNPDNSVMAVAGAGVLFYCVQAFFGISMCITAPFLWVGLAILMNNYDGGTNNEKRKKNRGT